MYAGMSNMTHILTFLGIVFLLSGAIILFICGVMVSFDIFKYENDHVEKYLKKILKIALMLVLFSASGSMVLFILNAVVA